DGCAGFRCHIGNGGTVKQAEAVESRAKKLNEFAGKCLLAQYLCYRQHDIGRRNARAWLAKEAAANDFRNGEANRLSQGNRCPFQSPYSPAKYRQGIDHGSVAVHADQGIGYRPGLTIRLNYFYHVCEIFKIDLMAYSATGWK